MTPDEAATLGFGTRAVHGGLEPDPSTGAINTPIYYSSTFAHESPGQHKGYEYSRSQNPTRDALERNLAALAGADFAATAASGSAASATLLHLLKKGDRVTALSNVYSGTRRLFEWIFRQVGIGFDYCAATPEALASALHPETRMVWLETPSNPSMELCDIAAIDEVLTAKMGNRRRKVTLVVDNTLLTPYFQRPLELGADVSLYSLKYLAGHSDVIGGASMTNDRQLHGRLQFIQNAVGGVLSPMDSFLTLRGIKSLHIRMERHQASAVHVARWLEARTEVRRVVYPGSAGHPQHELASRQQRGGGGVLTFYLHGTLERIRRFLESLRIIRCAESFGGSETLVEHPALMSHASLTPEQRAAEGVEDGMIRLSVGLEDPEDLTSDLGRALQIASQHGEST